MLSPKNASTLFAKSRQSQQALELTNMTAACKATGGRARKRPRNGPASPSASSSLNLLREKQVFAEETSYQLLFNVTSVDLSWACPIMVMGLKCAAYSLAYQENLIGPTPPTDRDYFLSCPHPLMALIVWNGLPRTRRAMVLYLFEVGNSVMAAAVSTTENTRCLLNV